MWAIDLSVFVLNCYRLFAFFWNSRNFVVTDYGENKNLANRAKFTDVPFLYLSIRKRQYKTMYCHQVCCERYIWKSEKTKGNIKENVQSRKICQLCNWQCWKSLTKSVHKMSVVKCADNRQWQNYHATIEQTLPGKTVNLIKYPNLQNSPWIYLSICV